MFHCKKVGPIVFCLVFLSCVGQISSAQTGSSKPAPPTTRCTVDHESPSDAQLALDGEEYAKAESLFQQQLTANPANEQARTGLIRTLIEESKVADAQTRAEAFLKEQPTSSVALETMGEVRFRQGDLQEAYSLAGKAVAADPCNARAYLLQSWFEDTVAMYAMRRGHVITAHKLNPEDHEILWAWINTLPHKERIDALNEYVTHQERISERWLTSLKEYLAHEQDYKSDDCTMAAGSASEISVPMNPIPYHTLTWGVDVQFNGKVRQLDVDTSARGLVLSRRAAAALGLTTGQKMGGAAIGYKGVVNGSIARVASVKIGKMEFHNCNVLVLEKDTVSEEDGVIGGNVFANHLLTLDFPAHRMRVGLLPKRPENAMNTRSPGSKDGTPETATEENASHNRYIAPEMQDWSNFYRIGQTLLLPTNIGGNGDKLFKISNESMNLITPAAAQEVTKLSKDSITTLYSSSGVVKHVMQTGQFTWIFAGVGQKVYGITAIDLNSFSHALGTEVSGVIGAPILNQLVIHIDYRDNLIKFENGQ